MNVTKELTLYWDVSDKPIYAAWTTHKSKALKIKCT